MERSDQAVGGTQDRRAEMLKVLRFIPTPERVSQYLERNTQEVMTQMESVDGREKLYTDLLVHQEALEKVYPEFNPNELRRQLDLVGDTLSQKKLFLEQVKSPEKKRIFRRAFDRVKGFAKKHPVITTLLVLSLAASGVAAGFYLTGNWELLMTSTGLRKIFGGAKAARELIPLTPQTPLLPDGGVFEVPLPTSPPDLGHTG